MPFTKNIPLKTFRLTYEKYTNKDNFYVFICAQNVLMRI